MATRGKHDLESLLKSREQELRMAKSERDELRREVQEVGVLLASKT